MKIYIRDSKGIGRSYKLAEFETSITNSNDLPDLVSYEGNFYCQIGSSSHYQIANPIIVIPDGELEWKLLN